MITTKKMNLFDAPENAMILHACNCLGVQGAGIAKVFKNKYPLAFRQYARECREQGSLLLGRSLIVEDSSRIIGCLFTSYDFGDNVDSTSDILKATRTAIVDICESSKLLGITEIYSNKFNSGLFGVPWEESEAVLIEVLNDYPEINWVVTEM